MKQSDARTETKVTPSSHGEVRAPRPSIGAMTRRNALTNSDYRHFTIGSVCYFCGWWLQRVTLAWTTWEMSRSPLWLGVLGATEIVPIILLGAFSGVILDRGRRIDVLRGCQLFAAVIAVGLAVFSIMDFLSVGLAVLFFFARGAVNAVYLPSALAFAPTLINKDQWNSAISINSIVINVSMTAGPALAGLILFYSSPEVAYFISACLNIIYFCLLFTVSERHTPIKTTRGLLSEAAAGCLYALRHSVIRSMLLVFLIATLGVRSMIDLLPGYAGSIPYGDPRVLSLLSASIGLGAVTGSIWMTFMSSIKDIDLASYVTKSFIAMVFASAAFSIFLTPLVSVPTLFVMGFTIAINGIGTQTVIQHEVSELFRGRVMALYSIIFRGGWGLGAIVISTLADRVGLRFAGAGAALLCLLVFVWLLIRAPQLSDKAHE